MKILKLITGHKEYNFSHGVNVIVGDRSGAFKQALYTALGFHIFGKTFLLADTSALQNPVYAFLTEDNTEYFIGYDINGGNKFGFLKGTANGENLTPRQFYRAFYSNFIQEECCLFVNRYDFAHYTGCCGHNFDKICGYGDIFKYYRNYFSARGGRHSAFNMYQFEHIAKDYFRGGVRMPSVPFYDKRLFMRDDFSLYLGDKNGVSTDISPNEQAIFDLMCLVNIGKIAERFYYKNLKPLLIFGLDKSRLLDFSGVLNYAANSGRQVFLFTDDIQTVTRIGRGYRINVVEGERKNMDENQLYKGVFWIADLENICANRAYCFKIPCDVYGYPADSNLNLNAKSGLTYNHRLLWEMLDSKLTGGKPYNYYPRGRVEIRNGTARIYLNGNINTEEIMSFLVDEFNLTAENGITKVIAKTDNGTHYLCHLDDGYTGDNKRKQK